MKGSLTKVLALITSVIIATGDSNSRGLGASTASSDQANNGPIPGPPPAPMMTSVPPPAAGCKSIITQSSSQAITASAYLCAVSHPPPGGNLTTDTSLWRAFDMATFAGGRKYFVSSVSFGVNSTADAQVVRIRLYTNNGGTFPQGTRTEIASTLVGLSSGQSGTIVTTPLLAVVPDGTNQLLMEAFVPASPSYCYLGGNTEPEGGLSYWSSACTSFFPNPMSTHIVFNVYGGCAPGSR